jgi:hypothetical protein
MINHRRDSGYATMNAATRIGGEPRDKSSQTGPSSRQKNSPEVEHSRHHSNDSINDYTNHMTNITTPFSGGCACGSIRYDSTAEPIVMLHCHCRDCQRSSGGPFSSFLVVAKEAFKLLQGSLRFHASPSQMGGQTHRGFCPDCGSPILVKPDAIPHLVAIRTASLDDPSWFNPQVNVWTSDAHPWDQMDPAVPKFENYPPPAPPADPVAVEKV